MLSFLPKPLIGIFAVFCYIVLFVGLSIYIFAIAPVKFIVPMRGWQNHFTAWYRLTPRIWTSVSNFIMRLTTKTKWDIQVSGSFDKLKSYIVMSNHISWMDIAVVQRAINKVSPPAVYFMKQQLIWMPFVGWACWLMGFPFMRRHKKSYIAKHPEKAGQDMATTKKSCEKYRDFPVTLVNFTEGTRRTKAKHDAQQSPYKHLLKPKSGGLAFALQVMGDQVKSFVNVTIVYPNAKLNMWDMLCGRAKAIIVYVDCLPVPADLQGGDYRQDRDYRCRFQAWLNGVWEAKDNLIDSLLAK
tara:strand:+ start:11896 stop:12789 length:894 start_codon:yes stop_codon:yes gene_type:complete